MLFEEGNIDFYKGFLKHLEKCAQEEPGHGYDRIIRYVLNEVETKKKKRSAFS